MRKCLVTEPRDETEKLNQIRRAAETLGGHERPLGKGKIKKSVEATSRHGNLVERITNFRYGQLTATASSGKTDFRATSMAPEQETQEDIIKGPWSPEEDEVLKVLIEKHGPRNWSVIAQGLKGRSGKSCRLRWCNQLNPEVHISRVHGLMPSED